MKESRARKNNRTSAIFLDRRQNTDSSGMDNWLVQRRLGKLGLSDSTPEVNKAGAKDCKDRITLDELSNLYKNEEMEQEETRRKEEEVKTKLTKKINRLSLMSDIELPDTRHSDLGIDLEKGIFLRRHRGDTDSGNNSLNTNKSNSSTGTSQSSKQSQPIESSFMEEDEDDYAENLKMSPEELPSHPNKANPSSLPSWRRTRTTTLRTSRCLHRNFPVIQTKPTHRVFLHGGG